MRISDWSSDVCSSDLQCEIVLRAERTRLHHHQPVNTGQRITAIDCAKRIDRLEPITRFERAADPRQFALSRSDQRHIGPFAPIDRQAGHDRSEEHTSELQSLMRISYAVFCLKNKHQHTHHIITTYPNIYTNI